MRKGFLLLLLVLVFTSFTVITIAEDDLNDSTSEENRNYGDSIVGLYKTYKKTMTIAIFKCQAEPVKYCGRIVGLKNDFPDRFDVHNPDEQQRQRKVYNLKVIKNLTYIEKDNEWRGFYYSINDGTNYYIKLKYDKDQRLNVFVSLDYSFWIFKSSIWTPTTLEQNAKEMDEDLDKETEIQDESSNTKNI